MTTTTLYSKKERFTGLYKSTLRRNIGYLGLLSLLVFVFYPLQYLMEAFRNSKILYLPTGGEILNGAGAGFERLYMHNFYGLGLNYTGISGFFATMLFLAMPVVLALMLNGYMQSKKASDVYHSLPVERSTLLSVNAAVAMTMLAVPLVGSTLIIFIVQVTQFGFIPDLAGFLLLDMFGWLACMFAIYAITTCVCVCAGTIFDSFVFSGVVLFTIPAICGLVVGLCSAFLYGFRANEEVLLSLSLLSPVTVMPFRFLHRFWDFSSYATPEPDAMQARQLLYNNLAIVFYLALAIGVMALAIYLYRRRSSEVAETTSSKGVLQTIVKFSGTMVSGICFGFIFYAISYPASKASFITWTLIGGLIAYIVLEVILNRGFKTLMRSLPMCAVMLAVTLIIPIITMTGGFGYETRVPTLSQIESVELDYSGRYGDFARVISAGPYNEETGFQPTSGFWTVKLLEEDNINTVRTFHDYLAHEQFINNETQLLDEGKIQLYYSTTLTYKLRNGKEVKRYYYMMSQDALAQLMPLETAPEVLLQANPVFAADPNMIFEWHVQDPFGSNNLKQVFSKEESAQLLAAMQNDLKAVTLEDLKAQKKPIAYVRFSANLPREGAERTAQDGYMAVTDPSQETYRFLQQKGLLEKITPDISKCHTVSVSLEYAYHGGNNRPFLEAYPTEDFNALQLEEERRSMQEELSWYAEDSYAYADMVESKYWYGGSMRAFFEDPREIALLADNIVSSVEGGTPFVRANFYFEGASSGTTVLIPLDRLPKEIQDRITQDDFIR